MNKLFKKIIIMSILASGLIMAVLTFRRSQVGQHFAMVFMQNAVIWEDADLDHDGENESIHIREVIADELYEMTVVKKDGTVLWSTEAGLPHVAWNTILLYEEDGKDYLIQYLPYMNQGIASYVWTQFFWENGELKETASMNVDFKLPLQINSELTDFAEETNLMLEDSIVLLSTENGELVIGPKATVDVPQLYPVRFDPNEIRSAMYKKVQMDTIEAMACFVCQKG